ncbi:MAG: EAL domain-containing protein [Zoogloea sp.]|uniref:EAL domain-containing protein n=1 Tax=Zoogloea sp. TaxID=49181 RepID=UPI00261F5045|nr:EAL domain-containing protein [Zoogloea sp.]MDD3327358.1 EAL domain-containing protein [Zoogloea sp.]
MSSVFVSLRWRLVVPLLALWAIGIVLLVSVVYASILERFQTLVEERADGIVAAVCSVAEAARDPADLRRFLSSLGAARDVRRVALVAGRPLRVVASSDHSWHDQPLAALPDPALAEAIERVKASRKAERRLDGTRRVLEVLEPVLLVDDGHQNGRLADGVLLLRLDASALWWAARDTVLSLSLWLGGILSAVAGLILLMVSRYVLRPADEIRAALGRRQTGGVDIDVPVGRRDELGELAAALNEMLDTLRTRNRQLARARDQHLAMLEGFPHLAWRANVKGECDWFNRAWLTFTGRTLEQEANGGWLEALHPDDREACLTAYRRAFEARESFVLEYRLRAADGSYHWIADHGAPIHDADGLFTGYVGSCYDLQPARDHARDIKRMTRLYHALSDTNKAIVHTRDAATLLPQVCRIAVEFGELDLAWIAFPRGAERALVVEAIYQRAGRKPIPPEQLRCRQPLDALLARPLIVNEPEAAAGAAACEGCVARDPDSSFAFFPIRIADGGADADGVLALRKDERGFFDEHTVRLIEELTADVAFALRSYRREDVLRLAAKVFENNSEGIVISDCERRVVMTNRAFATLTGYDEETVRGSVLELFDPPHHPEGFVEMVREQAAEAGAWQGEVWLRRVGGETFPAALSLSVVRNDEGQVTHYVAVFSDVSQQKADEARIRFLASHDFLTGLPSRAELATMAAEAAAQADRRGRRLALCFLDLDRFKNVNDTLGHHVGDQLLIEVARRLESVLRPGESVLRHGGDEFVVLIPEGDDGAGLRAGATRLLAALDEPFRLAGCEFSLSTSVGVAVYPDDGRDAEILLDRADMAMYRAKEAGRNGVEFFTPGMDSVGSERLSLEYALRGALDRDELVLHYQPLMSADGRLVGAEALVRWQHPELGLLLPGRFIPIAEESGLILSIGNRLLHAVCAQLAAWRSAGLPLVPVAVNISALQFRRADFVDSVAAALRRHDIPAALLTLELTESMVMRDVEQVARQLSELKALGVAIAIDDFGTGYSSLAYLKRFPLDKLKIDQSFVREINAGPEDRAIVASIVGLGHNLGLELVAEGVETESMASTLRQLGCDALQGWCYGHAEPAEVFAARLGPAA